MSAQDGKREELLEILLKASRLLEENDDCILYVVSRMKDDENAVWINETWTSEDAHDRSLDPDNIRELVMSALPLLATKPEGGLHLETVGGKGL